MDTEDHEEHRYVFMIVDHLTRFVTVCHLKQGFPLTLNVHSHLTSLLPLYPTSYEK